MDSLIKFANWLIDFLLPNGKVDSVPKGLALFICVLVLSILAFIIAAEIFEKVLAQITKIRANGIPFFKSDATKKALQRRRLFLHVLKGDLDNIARKENWNDLAFSELDAEVELEGSFYPSNVAKFRKSVVTGRRKISSLTQALSQTAKNHLLLLGEPGSGKSVAMRHLAIQMADRAIKSSTADVLIPLYVNLREFERPNYSDLSPNSIRSFILDNVRRDSPQTTEYIEQHWTEYCERGLWFFLFDSFDEIPEILHSAESEELKHRYSEAIRNFLAKTGSCQAILASREYRCPETLDWDKLRLLPLSFSRKVELIECSLISESAKKKILHFLLVIRYTSTLGPVYPRRRAKRCAAIEGILSSKTKPTIAFVV